MYLACLIMYKYDFYNKNKYNILPLRKAINVPFYLF